MDALDNIWSFISDEANRSTIGWAFGGIAGAASSLWAAVRYLTRKEKRLDSKPQQQFVNADRGGVAGGRDVVIGLRGLYLFLILLVVVSLAIIVASRFGDRFVGYIIGNTPPLAEAKLNLFCGMPDDPKVHWVHKEEAHQLATFVQTLAEHSGEPIYARVLIETACGMCACERELADFNDASSLWGEIDKDPEYILIEGSDGFLEVVPNPSYRSTETEVQGVAFFEKNTVEERADWGFDAPIIWKEGYEIFATLPNFWPYSYYIYLPKRHHLSSSQYSSGAYGFAVAFDGIFIARSYDQTGGGVRHLEPVDISPTLEQKLKCIREKKLPTTFNKIFWGC